MILVIITFQDHLSHGRVVAHQLFKLLVLILHHWCATTNSNNVGKWCGERRIRSLLDRLSALLLRLAVVVGYMVDNRVLV